MSKPSIHLTMLSEARKHFAENPSPQFEKFQIAEDEVALNMMFRNHRSVGNLHKGLRLSPMGHEILSLVFEHYTYTHSGNGTTVNNKAISVLDRFMEWPYYLDRNEITFYGSTDAAWYALGGDLSNFIGSLERK